MIRSVSNAACGSGRSRVHGDRVDIRPCSQSRGVAAPANDPLPDPAWVTKLSHPDRLVAVQARVEDPVPEMVTKPSPRWAPPA